MTAITSKTFTYAPAFSIPRGAAAGAELFLSACRLLAGLNRDYSGTLRWHGEDVRANGLLYAPQLLYLGHQPALKTQLSARENLDWYARCCGASSTAVLDALDACCRVGQ